MVDRINRTSDGRSRAGRILAVAALGAALGLTFAATAIAGPSPVLLGTSGEFSVLGGSGLTNTGVTTLEGDIGSSPTHGETGFTPCPAASCVNLTGANHNDPDPNDAVTQQAKTDLQTAYDDAFGRTGGAAIAAPLGSGQTLVPGVYTSATNISVGGDLTLDALGDPSAVFIFQAKTGVLLTAAGIANGIPNTRVLLTNAAQACNVYWQVGTSATLGTFTQFVGNVLADQSITVDSSATLDGGRVLASNGAVTLNTNTIRKGTCATPPPAGTTTPAAPASPTDTTTPAPGATAPSPTGTTPVSTKPDAADDASPKRRSRAGSARITGPSDSDSVEGKVTVSVTGRSIRLVTFYVDGRRRGTVRAKPGRTKYTLAIDTSRQSHRVHRVTARVTFTTSSRMRGVTRRFTYRRASLLTRAPAFTG